MAKNVNGMVSGVLGPVVYYSYNGKNYIRTKKASKKKPSVHSKTMHLAEVFGKASRISSDIRRELSAITPNYKEASMRYRFNNAVRLWLQNIDSVKAMATEALKPKKRLVQGAVPPTLVQNTVRNFLDHFQFNDKAPLSEKLRLMPSLDWNQPKTVAVNIPAVIPNIDVAAPPGTVSVKWQLLAFSHSFEKRDTTWPYLQTNWEVTYDGNGVEAKTIEMPINSASGYLTFVVLGLKYIVAGEEVTDPRWTPVGVLGTRYQE